MVEPLSCPIPPGTKLFFKVALLQSNIGFCIIFQLRYGEPVIRRAVPLALALISASNPQLKILDTLGKFSHDNDPEVSYNSILALGIVGAGLLFLSDCIHLDFR